MANFGPEWREAKFDPTTRRIANTASAGTKAPAKRRSKYNAVRTAVDPVTLFYYDADDAHVKADWVVFDSRREAVRYTVLMVEQRNGTISGLTLQQSFALTTTGLDGVKREVAIYKCDFAYIRDGRFVCEDCKGFRTEVYRLKKRWLLLERGIEIFET